QAMTFFEQSAITAPEGVEQYAVYHEYNKFVLVFETEDGRILEGGMLLQPDRVTAVGTDHGGAIDFDAIEPGTVFPIVGGSSEPIADARRVYAEHTVDHGDHSDRYQFELVSAKTGTIGDV